MIEVENLNVGVFNMRVNFTNRQIDLIGVYWNWQYYGNCNN